MKVLLIDNYDSFTYNIVHYLESFDIEVNVVRQDRYEHNLALNVDKIVFSPGPGLPSQSKGMLACLNKYTGQKPILGICLGMQAIVEAQGGRLYNLPLVQHGVTTEVLKTSESKLLSGIPQQFIAGLYHSWGCDVSATNKLIEIAISTADVTMAIENTTLGLYGVQFHPESILTPNGKQIIQNFIQL